MDNNFSKEMETGSKTGIVKKNIINYYINFGNLTIPDLSRELNLSIPTVTKLIAEMSAEGLIADYGKVETSGGRHPNLYGLDPSSNYFIGVDMKENTLNIGLIDFTGKILEQQEGIPLQEKDSDEALEVMGQIILSFIEKLTINKKKIRNINLSIAGRVNPTSGHTYNLFFPEKTSPADILEKKIGYPVSIDNDTRAMAYGEYMAGNVKGEKNVIFVNVSWGLAVGIIINGKLYSGKSGFAGEFGHTNTHDNEIICRCGKKGCLETEASGLAIHRILLERIKAGASSVLSAKVKKGEAVTLQDIIDAVNKEDVLCIDIIEEVGQKLGKQIAGLINLFNPELVIIGGTVSLTEDYIMQPIKTAVKKYSLNLVNRDSKIVVSKLKDKASIIGSCMLARRKVFEE